MILDLNKSTIGEKIKIIAAYRGLNLKTVGEEFNKRQGTKYNATSFQRKIRNNSLSYDELTEIGDILGFDVDIKLRD